MKKKIIKFFLLVSSLLILIIIYLSFIGLETEKFNRQIKEKITQTNKNLEIKLKKIKLTLDLSNFKIKAKTIGVNILYKGKPLELEYVKTQISILSLIKDKFVSSNLEFSTKSILLKDLISFIKATTNKPEFFILEKTIKKGQVIADVKLNFDENGEISQDYIINARLKDGKIELFKNYNFEKINFILDAKNDIFSFKDVSFLTNKTSFFSNNLVVVRDKRNFKFEGEIQNKDSNLNNELLKLFNLNFKNLNLLNTNFTSKNKFSFNVNNKFKIKNILIDSDIQINKSDYLKPSLLSDYLPEVKNIFHIKDHKIKSRYKKNNLTIQGSGKIQLEQEFDEINYKINLKENKFNLDSNIKLNKLTINNQEFLKSFFPKSKKVVDLKNQQIEIKYNNDNLLIKGFGKIKLEKEFEDINFNFLKSKNKFDFYSQLDFKKTIFKIDFLNFENNVKSKTKIKIRGTYNKDYELNFSEIDIIEKNNKIILRNLLLNKNNLIIKVDKFITDYIDTENKKNQFLLLRNQKDDYKFRGDFFNANKLIDNLLKNKNKNKLKILKNNINLSLNLKNVFIDKEDVVKELIGKLSIIDNEVVKANISSFFDKNEYLTFTINTNNVDEKITTLFSSRAKPIVKKYEFIKGYEEGYLDFYSSKKNNISTSKLKIYDFKLQKLPVLTKLLTLASLQGIADTLSGEGIRFKEFEMNFKNKDNLMTIDEIYAIGPAISILMSGYVEEDKLISLRGTLVPATTINKSIGSIPLLGKILVGDKTGEGVFGVSFKIKGQPKNLETTVNPIKSLTPRFITRTLEKIKKN
jgi:hypothetical protein